MGHDRGKVLRLRPRQSNLGSTHGTKVDIVVRLRPRGRENGILIDPFSEGSAMTRSKNLRISESFFSQLTGIIARGHF